jgi:hypothetical protein
VRKAREGEKDGVKDKGSSLRPARQARPRGRPRTGAPLHPALAEFLREIGHMAADAVLAKYREAKELAPVSIKSPGGNNRSPEAPGTSQEGGRFGQGSGSVQVQEETGSHGR